MPDDKRNRMLAKLDKLIGQEGKGQPEAINQAESLVTDINALGSGIQGIITATREQDFVKPGERPPTLPTPPPPIDPSKVALGEQVSRKPEINVEDRLPFLKGRDIDPNLRQPEQSLVTGGDIVTEGETKRENLPFQQRALNQINSTLLQMNLHDSGIGELSREIITPIVAGTKRLQEGGKQLGELKPEGLGNIALGIAGTAFGTAMMPFGLARATGEQLGGKTGGQIAELTSLGLAGGIPLIAGYFAAQGASDIAERLMNGTNLTDKQKETIGEVVGLFAFIGGAKAGSVIKGKISTKLQKSVEKYIDGIPDIVKAEIKPLNQPLRELRKELVTEKTGIQKAKVIKEQEAVKTLKQKEIHNRKRNPKTGQLEKAEPTIEVKKPQVFEDNKTAINKVLDGDASLSTNPLMISKRLTTLVEKGELKKKVSTNTIKEIANEWIANRQKTKVQKFKSIPVEDKTIPGFFGEKTNPSIKDLQKEFPEVNIKGKTYEQVVKDFRTAWEMKKTGVKDAKEIEELGKEGKEKPQEVKISEIKDEPVPNKTVENIKKAQEIVGKDEFTKIATKLSEGKETLLKRTFTEELANDIVKEGKLPDKYKVEVKPKPIEVKENEGANLELLTERGKQHLANLIKSGVDKKIHYAEWSKKMAKEFGDGVKPQLLRAWTQMKKESTPPPLEGEKKVRGFAKSTEKRAIESGLVNEIKNLPEYEPKRDKPRIEEVSKIIENDFERAKRIALGLETHPTVESGFFHEGLRLIAEKNGDANLIIELANSKITVQATEAGQFIQALKDHNPLSSVRAVKEIIKERVSRVKDYTVKKKNIKKEVKAQMKKNNLKFKDWDSFIKSIRCI